MKYQIRHTTKYAYTEPAPVCHNVVHLAPRSTAWQTCRSYRLTVVPEPAERTCRTDYFGNRVDYFTIHEAHRGLAITAVSEVDVEPRGALAAPVTTPAWNAVAAELAAGDASRDPGIAQFRFASEYVPLAEQFADYAKTSLKPDCPIVEGVADLTARIHADFRFDPKATNLSTPVREVFERRAGVCQDFAHLQLACLRSLGLAAQYVSGYLRTDPPPGKPRLVGADASHAWISVYCGAAGWIDFDPTNNVMPGVDHITVAYGRDYADICPIQGVFIGGGRHAMHVAVDVMPVE